MSQAGGLLLTETVQAVGLGRELSAALAPWRRSNAVHDPAKIVLTEHIVDELAKIPERGWQQAYDADGEPRPGAWVLEVTGLFNLTGGRRGCG